MFRHPRFELAVGPIAEGDLVDGRWTGVVAHALDAPVIRCEVVGPPPNFAEDERELHACEY